MSHQRAAGREGGQSNARARKRRLAHQRYLVWLEKVRRTREEKKRQKLMDRIAALSARVGASIQPEDRSWTLNRPIEKHCP